MAFAKSKFATFEPFNRTTAPAIEDYQIPTYDYQDITYPETLLAPQPVVQPTDEEAVVVVTEETDKPTGKRKFKRKSETTTKQYDHTISFQQLCKNIGVDVTVTSELRPGAKTSSGKDSNHRLTDEWGRSRAIDVVPKDGDFEGLKNKLLNSPEAKNWFQKRGYGIINEIIPQVKSKTKASGDHFHIGPDSWAQRIWNQWLQNPSLKATQFIG